MQKNMKIIVTAGPTNEKIDAVMKITNMSTGSMGTTTVETFLEEYNEKIDKIYYISSLLARKPKENEKIEFVEIDSTDDLIKALEDIFKKDDIDVIIHSSAVGDYKGKYVIRGEDLIEEIFEYIQNFDKKEITKESLLKILDEPKFVCNDETKISSYEPHLMTMFSLTPKVISQIKKMNPNVKLIGFKLLEGVAKEHLYEVAHKLLIKNDADYIVANDLSKIGNGKHWGMIIDKSGVVCECQTKKEIANNIAKLIF